MSCISLIGGGIGCGKTTFINYIQKNEEHLFGNNECNKENSVVHEMKTTLQTRNVCRIIFDELCSIEEQSQMMNTLKGWRNFRVDLLMAAEHFVNFLYNSKYVIFGPLTERSFHLLEKLKSINNTCTIRNETIFFVEDNFYYRSMRYDWFQLARRANIGFCEIFLDCPLYISIDRNLARGYNIPKEKILQMSTFMEYPEPDKYKWEKYSIIFNSSGKLDNSSLKEVIDTIQEAAKYPAELVIMADKIEAQNVCSKSIAHQADKILRKLISKKVCSYQGNFQGSDLKLLISEMTEIRQKLLHAIKQKSIDFPEDLLENLRNNGINSVKFEFEKSLSDSFEKLCVEQLSVNKSYTGEDRCIVNKFSEVS